MPEAEVVFDNARGMGWAVGVLLAIAGFIGFAFLFAAIWPDPARSAENKLEAAMAAWRSG